MDHALAIKVAQFFKESLPALSKTKKDKLTTGGTQYYSSASRLFHRLHMQLGHDDKKRLISLFGADCADFDTPPFDRELERALLAIYAAEGPAHGRQSPNTDRIYFNDVIKTPLSRLQLIYVVDNKKLSFLYDPDRDTLHRVQIEVIEERIKEMLGKEDTPGWYATNRLDCTPKYMPMEPRRVVYDEELEIRYFNTWREAGWRKGWVPDTAANCPPEIMELLNAIVVGSANRQAVLRWLRDAVFSRAEPILILRGIPGLGKNLLFESVLGALVGANNYQKAQAGFERSPFHGNIPGCRVFMLDEVPLTERLRELLKNYHNGRSTFERKNIEVGEAEEIHASFVLANNSKRAVKVEYADRKFFIPDLESRTLLETLGQDKIDVIVEYCKDDTFLRRLGSYLFCNFAPGSSKNFPKTESFKEIAEGSYSAWFRKLKKLCLTSEEVTGRTLSKSARAVDAYTVADELEHYAANFGHKLGELIVHDNGNWTVKSHIYVGDKDSASAEDNVTLS